MGRRVRLVYTRLLLVTGRGGPATLGVLIHDVESSARSESRGRIACERSVSLSRHRGDAEGAVLSRSDATGGGAWGRPYHKPWTCSEVAAGDPWFQSECSKDGAGSWRCVCAWWWCWRLARMARCAMRDESGRRGREAGEGSWGRIVGSGVNHHPLKHRGAMLLVAGASVVGGATAARLCTGRAGGVALQRGFQKDASWLLATTFSDGARETRRRRRRC